jgi:hypothetical protein
MKLLIAAGGLLVAGTLAAAQGHSHHPTAPVSPLAAEQIGEVRRAIEPLGRPESARAAGFEPALGWIPMMGTHWVHGPRMMDGKAGNLSRLTPSQLMFSQVDGQERLVGVAYAYYAPTREVSTPALFDGAPAWHDHPDLAPPGMNMLMLHVWLVPSPDGPFAGLNPFLPYWAAGVTPPAIDRMRHPVVSIAVRTAALALAEVVDAGGLFPILARRPAVTAVLAERRASIRAIVPELNAAAKAGDTGRWDLLVADLGRHWTAIREAYVTSALDPRVKARIGQSIDEMTAHPGK